ncbi:hypothetical protein LTR64_008655 [Lithohypha guttulata]|uniref:uncharacterized protein n=1 Tax=Lithohypha guttulata TaxID=1690604 RepID=UPI002DDED1DE|nr:hypothetical protein LTR51_008738 [Lithohypha guttulata]
MATKDHAVPEAMQPLKEEPASKPATNPEVKVVPEPRTKFKGKQETAAETSSSLYKNKDIPPTSDTKMPATESTTIASVSWIGWLAGGNDTQIEPSQTASLQNDQEIVQSNPFNASSLKVKPQTEEASQPQSDSIQSAQPGPSGLDKNQVQSSTSAQRRSWLPLWNNASAAQSAPNIASPLKDVKAQPLPDTTPSLATAVVQGPEPAESSSATTTTESSIPPPQPSNAGKSSAWVFWSRDKGAEIQSLKDAPREGELAVANTESENKPRRTSIDMQKPAKRTSLGSSSSKENSTLQKDKKVRPNTKTSSDLKQTDSGAVVQTTKAENKEASATAIAPADAETSKPATVVPAKRIYEHLLLPSLYDTLKLPEDPSLLERLTRLFYTSDEPELKHLNLVKDPPRVKNALAIGVHGYFPAPLIQSVLGRPTGTSIKFADMAAKSIKRYTKAKGYECNIKTAALEGEGKILERLDLLWKLLLNWIEEIRNSNARVGICAMAGVNMGPFAEFKSRWISGSAGELFEFADPSSKVSTDYLAALDEVLKFGARLTLTGSIDDQLVSMESSMFAPVSHPHIFRAVSIDSRLHAPSFISHLVALALKLRNVGIQDHGLIKELSAPLAGSLYTGEGHSRIYEDDAIYDLAVTFALNTTSIPGVHITKRNIDSSGSNPYILPFAMRGILEEDFVKSDLQQEASELLKEFDDWKPQTKALKDVKFRLEGIRSKL